MNSGKIFAIIPARGGSKGLPRKNTRELAGHPMIAYSIFAALECSRISRCIVSTEDHDIKNICFKLGAEVIDRPSELASDSALTRDVVRHILEELKKEGDIPEYFVLLQPTSPLRNAKHLQDCIDKFFASNAVCTISVTKVEHHPYKAFCLDREHLVPLIGAEYLDQPRQVLPEIFRQNGAIYLLPSMLFLEKNTFFLQPALPFIMTSEDSIDVDNEYDLFFAQNIIKKRKISMTEQP